MKSNFIKRTITGLILVGLLILLLNMNKTFITIAFTLIANIAIYELHQVLDKIGYKANLPLAILFNSIFIPVSVLFNNEIGFSMLFIYALAMFILVIFVDKMKINEVFTNIFIAVYLTISASFLVSLELKWIIYAIFITVLTDTFAYIFGILLGKHKLIPRLSPKKTVEGSIGGILGAVLFTIAFHRYYQLDLSALIIVASVIISIMSQIGDLFASYLKRMAGVKDYGKILIGHGGFMDRIDSLLVVGPLVYFLVNLMELL